MKSKGKGGNKGGKKRKERGGSVIEEGRGKG